MLPIISGLFVATLIIANITSVKLIDIGPFTFDGGTIIFPLAYILGDILTEIYGIKNARQIIWTGFASLLLFSLITWAVGRIPANAEWTNQASYDTILGSTPRIILASLIAYLAGELANATILMKIRKLTEGKHLWMRTLGSSVIGHALDTAIFLIVAFSGIFAIFGDTFGAIFSTDILISMFLSNYIWKLATEVAITPFLYPIVKWLRKKEGA
ncbi:MAG: queuosine precursor transporter [Candidatus Altimarinota bacterium]